MAKRPKKPKKIKTNTINSVPADNKTTPKSRQQIYSENYQKNKEKKKRQQQERYRQDKERIKAQKKINYAKKKAREELLTKQVQAKYYGAEAIKILMTFKEYTELSKEKRKLWQDFNWTMKDCQKAIKEGLGDIVAIMKLTQVADNLIRDFWDTAKGEERKKSKSWNNLDYDEQQRLIKYWGYEKARIENGYIDTAERLERQGQQYLKDIESAKFHEERGKVKCECYRCAESKRIQGEIKAQILKDEPKEKTLMIEGECSNCYEYKKVNSESGLCRKCGKE